MACPFDNPYEEEVPRSAASRLSNVFRGLQIPDLDWVRPDTLALLPQGELIGLYRAGRISRKSYKRAVRRGVAVANAPVR